MLKAATDKIIDPFNLQMEPQEVANLTKAMGCEEAVGSQNKHTSTCSNVVLWMTLVSSQKRIEETQQYSWRISSTV